MRWCLGAEAACWRAPRQTREAWDFTRLMLTVDMYRASDCNVGLEHGPTASDQRLLVQRALWKLSYDVFSNAAHDRRGRFMSFGWRGPCVAVAQSWLQVAADASPKEGSLAAAGFYDAARMQRIDAVACRAAFEGLCQVQEIHALLHPACSMPYTAMLLLADGLRCLRPHDFSSSTATRKHHTHILYQHHQRLSACRPVAPPACNTPMQVALLHHQAPLPLPLPLRCRCRCRCCRCCCCCCC